MKTKYAVIDTETNGLFDFKLPADAEGQARLAHFAAVLLNEDLEITEAIDLYVAPDGWEMQEEAQRVNGLTDEFLCEHGQPVEDVLQAYNQLIDEGYVMVAFNAQFDCKVMRGEMRRAGLDDRFEETPNICVMRACNGIVEKPGGGRGWPKLRDACAHFNITQPEEHKAHADAYAAARIFLELHAMDALPEARVHYAKNRPAA